MNKQHRKIWIQKHNNQVEAKNAELENAGKGAIVNGESINAYAEISQHEKK